MIDNVINTFNLFFKFCYCSYPEGHNLIKKKKTIFLKHVFYMF